MLHHGLNWVYYRLLPLLCQEKMGNVFPRNDAEMGIINIGTRFLTNNVLFSRVFANLCE